MTKRPPLRPYPEPDHDLLQPSDIFLEQAIAKHPPKKNSKLISSASRATLSKTRLENCYWQEQAEVWLAVHGGSPVPVTLEDLQERWGKELERDAPMRPLSAEARRLLATFDPTQPAPDDATRAARADALELDMVPVRREWLTRTWAWEVEKWLFWHGRFYHPTASPLEGLVAYFLRWYFVREEEYDDDAGEGTTPGMIRVTYLGDVPVTIGPENRPDPSNPPSPSRQLASIPYAFRDGLATFPSSLPIQGLFAALNAAPLGIQPAHKNGWHATSEGLLYHPHKKRGGTIVTSWQPPDGTTETSGVADLLLAKLLQLSDLDGDVLSSLLVQTLHHSQPDGTTWISAAIILDYRNIEPVWHQEGRTRRRGNHRTEDIRKIAECIERLNLLYVELQQVKVWQSVEGKSGKREVPLTRRGKVLNISEDVIQGSLLEEGALPVAWRYRMGEWLTPFLLDMRQTVLLLQKVLEYDHYRQTWEKRLGRYLTLQFRSDNKNQGPMRRAVSTLLEECSLSVDTTNPQRTRDRLEKALRQLVEDKVIGRWDYVLEGTADHKLPVRKWLPHWQKWVIDFLPPPAISVPLEGTAQVAQTAQKARAQKASPAPPRITRRKAAGG